MFSENRMSSETGIMPSTMAAERSKMGDYLQITLSLGTACYFL
jgi:hypothetical protein